MAGPGSTESMQDKFEALYAKGPPWDIGRPQPEVIRLAEAGEIRGDVLDVGCGTGEHAIFLAKRGHSVCGVDTVPAAIERAKQKARQAGVRIAFSLANALDLHVLGRTFDTVLDSGLFHVFNDAERAQFVKSLASAMTPGGTYLVLCFSEKETREGPRRVTQQELRDAFAHGWHVNYIRETLFESHIHPGGAKAWVASITRLFSGDAMDTNVKVLAPGEGELLNWLGALECYKLTGRETAGRYAIAWLTSPPGSATPAHIHAREDELFYVLDGEPTFIAGNQTIQAQAGSMVFVRRGTAHIFKNDGSKTATVLVAVNPAGFDEFQFEAGRRLANTDSPLSPPTKLDIERMLSLAPKYGLDVSPPASAFEKSPEVRVLHRGEGRAYSVVGDVYTYKLTGEETGGAFALFEFMVPPESGSPPHIHRREEEMFYVLEGEMTFFVEGKPRTAPAGTFVFAPRDIQHNFRNLTAAPVKMLCWVLPSGLENFFKEAGVELKDSSCPPVPPDAAMIERMVAAAPKYGLEIVVPQ